MALITETMKVTMAGPEFEDLTEAQRTMCRFLYLAGAFAAFTAINEIEVPDEEAADKQLTLLVQDVAEAFAEASKEVITTHMLNTLPPANTRPS